jgi:hypothetical protein
MPRRRRNRRPRSLGSAAAVIGDRWGVTDAEVARRYPCDEVVAAPTLEAWRGITVRATADRVWPWLGQIRLAPYSYDWIDNLGRRSPRELRGLPEPRVGEPFSAAFGGRAAGRIVSVEPGVQLTGIIMGAAMSYVLVPLPDGSGATRLLLKLAGSGSPTLAQLLCAGDLVMARRQLRTLARLAEATAENGRRDQGGQP